MKTMKPCSFKANNIDNINTMTDHSSCCPGFNPDVVRSSSTQTRGLLTSICVSKIFQYTSVLTLMLLMLLTLKVADAHESSDVGALEGASGFNKVRLHWRYPRMGPGFQGFKITHCEDQAWGHHRCRNVVLHPNELSQSPLRNGLVEYSGQVSQLRMATNYTIQVTPVMDDEASGPQGDHPKGRTSAARGRAIPNTHHSAQVFIQTKGFSARAVSCLTNSTLVEVNTGPSFRGRISVEGSQNPACATQGNGKSSTKKYRLDINHTLCGSKMVNESVRTYILVQENLPILTHSTRRFMVVCHYVPEAFTVSAGVSLPEESGPSLVPVDNSINEVDPSELFDSTNDLFGSANGIEDRRRLTSRRTGKALKLSQEEDDHDDSPRMWSQLVLMVILVVGAVVGLSCAFWHFGRHAGFAARGKRETIPSAMDELENIERAGSCEPVTGTNETETDQQQQEEEEEEEDGHDSAEEPQELQQQHDETLTTSSTLVEGSCESFQNHLLTCETQQMANIQEPSSSVVDSSASLEAPKLPPRLRKPLPTNITENVTLPDSVILPDYTTNNEDTTITSGELSNNKLDGNQLYSNSQEDQLFTTINVQADDQVYVNSSVDQKWEKFEDECCDDKGPLMV